MPSRFMVAFTMLLMFVPILTLRAEEPQGNSKSEPLRVVDERYPPEEKLADDVKTRLNDLESRIRRVISKMDTLQDKLDRLAERMERLQRLEDRMSRIDTLESKIERLDDEVRRLERNFS